MAEKNDKKTIQEAIDDLTLTLMYLDLILIIN